MSSCGPVDSNFHSLPLSNCKDPPQVKLDPTTERGASCMLNRKAVGITDEICLFEQDYSSHIE